MKNTINNTADTCPFYDQAAGNKYTQLLRNRTPTFTAVLQGCRARKENCDGTIRILLPKVVQIYSLITENDGNKDPEKLWKYRCGWAYVAKSTGSYSLPEVGRL